MLFNLVLQLNFYHFLSFFLIGSLAVFLAIGVLWWLDLMFSAIWWLLSLVLMFVVGCLLFSDTGCHQMKSKHLYKNGCINFNWLWLSVAFAVGGCGSSVLVAVNGFCCWWLWWFLAFGGCFQLLEVGNSYNEATELFLMWSAELVGFYRLCRWKNI